MTGGWDWDLVLSSIVGGAVNGGVLALLALGLALIHKSTGVLNLAQGSMATFAVFVSAVYLAPRDVPMVVMLLATIGIGGLVAVATDTFATGPLRSAPKWTLAIVTLAVALLLDNLVQEFWGQRDRVFPALFGKGVYRWGLVAVSRQQLVVLGATGMILLGTAWFFRRTRTGLAMRAVASNRVGAELVGIRVERVQRLAWFVGGGLAGVAGFLIAPITFVTPGMMESYLFRVVAVAILAGLDSLAGAVIGALLFGIAVELAPIWIEPEFRPIVPLVAVVVALAYRPTGLLSAGPAREI